MAHEPFVSTCPWFAVLLVEVRARVDTGGEFELHGDEAEAWTRATIAANRRVTD